MSANLPQLRTSRLLAPDYVADGTVYRAGANEVHVMHPGIAHTHSDAIVWVPGERVLFTGDLVANGPYNAVADSTIHAWIGTLDTLRALRPAVVIPGHGPAGGPELIEAQQNYFVTVTRAVDDALARDADIATAIPGIRATMLANPAVANFVNDHHLNYSGFLAFHDLVATIVKEKTGHTIARLTGAPPPARCCGDLSRARQVWFANRKPEAG